MSCYVVLLVVFIDYWLRGYLYAGSDSVVVTGFIPCSAFLFVIILSSSSLESEREKSSSLIYLHSF